MTISRINIKSKSFNKLIHDTPKQEVLKKKIGSTNIDKYINKGWEQVDFSLTIYVKQSDLQLMIKI